MQPEVDDRMIAKWGRSILAMSGLELLLDLYLSELLGVGDLLGPELVWERKFGDKTRLLKILGQDKYQDQEDTFCEVSVEIDRLYSLRCIWAHRHLVPIIDTEFSLAVSTSRKSKDGPKFKVEKVTHEQLDKYYADVLNVTLKLKSIAVKNIDPVRMQGLGQASVSEVVKGAERLNIELPRD